MVSAWCVGGQAPSQNISNSMTGKYSTTKEGSAVRQTPDLGCGLSPDDIVLSIPGEQTLTSTPKQKTETMEPLAPTLSPPPCGSARSWTLPSTAPSQPLSLSSERPASADSHRQQTRVAFASSVRIASRPPSPNLATKLRRAGSVNARLPPRLQCLSNSHCTRRPQTAPAACHQQAAVGPSDGDKLRRLCLHNRAERKAFGKARASKSPVVSPPSSPSALEVHEVTSDTAECYFAQGKEQPIGFPDGYLSVPLHAHGPGGGDVSPQDTALLMPASPEELPAPPLPFIPGTLILRRSDVPSRPQRSSDCSLDSLNEDTSVRSSPYCIAASPGHALLLCEPKRAADKQGQVSIGQIPNACKSSPDLTLLDTKLMAIQACQGETIETKADGSPAAVSSREIGQDLAASQQTTLDSVIEVQGPAGSLKPVVLWSGEANITDIASEKSLGSASSGNCAAKRTFKSRVTDAVIKVARLLKTICRARRPPCSPPAPSPPSPDTAALQEERQASEEKDGNPETLTVKEAAQLDLPSAQIGAAAEQNLDAVHITTGRRVGRQQHPCHRRRDRPSSSQSVPVRIVSNAGIWTNRASPLVHSSGHGSPALLDSPAQGSRTALSIPMPRCSTSSRPSSARTSPISMVASILLPSPATYDKLAQDLMLVQRGAGSDWYSGPTSPTLTISGSLTPRIMTAPVGDPRPTPFEVGARRRSRSRPSTGVASES